MCSPAAFGYSSFSGWCEQGGVRATVQGINSSTTAGPQYFQQSYPNLNQSAAGPHITVYLPGTTTKATIYSDNSATALANPFPCSAAGVYQFFTDNGTYDLLFSGTGITSFTRSSVQGIDPSSISAAINVKAAPCLAKGDGTTNDTTAINTCLSLMMTTGKPLYFPTGTYLSCGASITGTGPANLFGDGAPASIVNPYGGAASCNSDAIKIATTGAITLHDLGTDGKRSGQQDFSANNITLTGTGSAGTLSPPSSVTLYNLYTANAKSVGIQCTACQNVNYTNSTSYQNYFYGVSFASTGTTAAPIYTKGFNISGITSINEPIGIGLSFFLSDITISNITHIKAGSGLFQMPHAYVEFSGSTWDGVPSQGCFFDNNPMCGTQAGSWVALNFEGVSDWSFTTSNFSNISGVTFGFYCNGSNLKIPDPGTTLELPCSRGHVDDITIQDSTAGFPFLINATSNGGNPALGSTITASNLHLSNVNQCANITAVSGASLSHSECIGSANGGFTFSNIKGGAFRSNHCKNCNTAGGTTYATGTVTGSAASASITGSGTTFISGMVGGGFTAAGTTYEICARGSNTAITLCSPLVDALSASTYSIYYGGGGNFPGLILSGTGTYKVQVMDNLFENDNGNTLSAGILDSTGLTAAQSQITYNANNVCVTCVIYSPIPTTQPTLATCGGGSPALGTGSTNSTGRFIVGTGTVTACTLTFAGDGWNVGSLVGPSCLFADDTHSLAFTVTAASTSLYTISTVAAGSVNIAGDTVRYICSSPFGQTNQGQYPFPYFWK